MTTSTPAPQNVHVHMNVARCINCQHEHLVAQIPGQTWYDCPECKTNKSHVLYTFTRPGNHLTCTCKNQAFYISEQGAYCPNCGNDILKLTATGDA